FSRSNITLTDGVFIGERPDAAELLMANEDRLRDRTGETIPTTGFQQSIMEITKARAGKM
ncbi:MAG TPA: 3-hydroxyacyl-CoA dehydrogenase, partial [Noviherbaspirillum sp.]|nr:3-hydroxyacyl-CoA dehydrogenase [Noviherbaspirillum sp.]